MIALIYALVRILLLYLPVTNRIVVISITLASQINFLFANTPHTSGQHRTTLYTRRPPSRASLASAGPFEPSLEVFSSSEEWTNYRD